jgi:hypothetical protein
MNRAFMSAIGMTAIVLGVCLTVVQRSDRGEPGAILWMPPRGPTLNLRLEPFRRSFVLANENCSI